MGESALPDVIGDYRVEGVLGEGGMGRVYLAHDPGLDRKVAIKVLLDELARDPAMTKRFLREARAMAKVRSPHVVTVYQVGEGGGTPFMVMEVLEGEDLGARLKRGPLPLADAVRCAQEAVKGLAAADAMGIVHRDVKPANLFVVDDAVKLTDFGLARPVDGSGDLTQAGLVVGSPHYMAPELARGKPADRLSDIYALGATLFESCVGRVPYPASTAVDAVTAHITEPVPDLRALRDGVPETLARLVTRMLAKDPAERPQGYDDVLRVLESVAPELSIDKAPAHAAEPNEQDATKQIPLPVVESASALSSRDDIGARTSSPGLRSGALPAVRTKTLTVMFTDIAGYTERTGSQSREEAAHWLALHDSLLRPVIRSYRGDVVKTIGDALLVTFASPTDAVLCGTAIQDRLYLHNREAGAADQIHVRVALSAGEVRVHKGDVLGEPVNLAARLEKLATAGEVVLSDAVYATMNTAEVRLESRGTHTLKGIQREVTVYVAVPDAIEGAPPFGGRTLPALDDVDALKWVRDARAVATDAYGIVARDAQSLFARASSRLRSDKRARWAAAAVALLIVLLIGGVSASKLGAGDDGALSLALEGLQEKQADEALAVLESWPGDDVDERLQTLLRGEDWWPRHHAAALLKRRGKGELIDEQELAIKDLETGGTCQSRRFGLLRLKREGRDERALDAVKAASSRMPDNLCMALDLTSTERALRKKLR